MVMLGLDYAARHTEQQLREAIKLGIRFVVRYLAPPYLYDAKCILVEEKDMLESLGLGVVSVYQRRNTQLSDFDHEHAQLDANWALENAILVGQRSGPIYFAADFDAQPEHIPVLQAYLDEIRDIFARRGAPFDVGVYGSYRVVESISATHKWQTYAWSRGKVSKQAKFIQCHNGVNLAGGNNDLNVAWGDPGCWISPSDTSMPEMPRLQQGARGWHVSVLQSLLAREGYDTNGIDGIFGPATHAAVREYQAVNGLDVTGVAGPETWTRLVAAEADHPGHDIAALEKRIVALESTLARIRKALSDI